MDPYLLVFLAGTAGSLHCVGMCGGFVCALRSDPRGAGATVARHLTYNVGRLTSYCFIGALVGHLGLWLVGPEGEGTWASLAQRLLAAFSGLLLIAVGLQFLGLRQGARIGPGGLGTAWVTQALRQLLGAPSFGAPLAFGVANGLLPCPLVYAFAAQAAGSGGALEGLLVMGAFGLGTFPAMLLTGALGRWTPRLLPGPRLATAGTDPRAAELVRRVDWARQAVRVAGGFIVLLGLVTLARGVLPTDAPIHPLHLHGP